MKSQYDILEICKSELKTNYSKAFDRLFDLWKVPYKSFIDEINSLHYDYRGLEDKFSSLNRNEKLRDNSQSIRDIEYYIHKLEDTCSDGTYIYDYWFRAKKLRIAKQELEDLNKDYDKIKKDIGLTDLIEKRKEVLNKIHNMISETKNDVFMFDYQSVGVNFKYALIPELKDYTNFDKFYRNIQLEIANMTISETVTHLVSKYKIKIKNPELILT